MKNLIILIAFIFFAFTLNAQDVTKSLGTNASNVTYVGNTSDTITNTDSWSIKFNLASKNKRQGYHLQVVQDSVSGTPTTAAVLAGSDDGGTTKITISTVTWTGTTSDTTYYFSDVATGVLYRSLYLTITGTGTQKSKVSSIYGKIGDL